MTCSPNFIVNPETGAREITAEGRNKAVKAINREVRRMKRRLYLTRFRLQCQAILLKGRLALNERLRAALSNT